MVGGKGGQALAGVVEAEAFWGLLCMGSCGMLRARGGGLAGVMVEGSNQNVSQIMTGGLVQRGMVRGW